MSKLNYEALNTDERRELLMQVLGVSPDSISRLKSGEISLNDVLARRIKEVVDNPDDTTQCAIVCRNIKVDGPSYDTLLPDEYLDHINEMKARGGKFADDVILQAIITIDPFSSAPDNADGIGHSDETTEQGPSVSDPMYQRTAGTYSGQPFPGSTAFDRESFLREYAAGLMESTYPRPFVRYFARAFDMMICLLISDLIFCSAFKVNPLMSTNLMMPWMYLSYALMLCIEPLFLHFFGTTPGKFIFGIRLLSHDGGKLSVSEAYRRSFRLFRFGYGFLIPFYNFFRMIKSMTDCRIGIVLPWDMGIKIEKKQSIALPRVAAFIAFTFLISSLQLIVDMSFAMPPNKGAITEDQFYSNCAYIAKYNSLKPTASSDPYYEVTTVDGEVVSVTMTITEDDILESVAGVAGMARNTEARIYNHYNEMYIVFMAFAGAQPNADVISLNYGAVPTQLANALKSFSFEYAGLKITNIVIYEGYAPDSLYSSLYPLSGDIARSFKQRFIIEKTNN